jgi:hypothetical protein
VRLVGVVVGVLAEDDDADFVERAVTGPGVGAGWLGTRCHGNGGSVYLSHQL